MSRKIKLFVSLMLMLTMVGVKANVFTYAETRAAGQDQGDLLYRHRFESPGMWSIRVVIKDKVTWDPIDKLKVKAIYYDDQTDGNIIRVEDHVTDVNLPSYNLQIEADAMSENIKRMDIILDEDLDYVVVTGSANTKPIPPVGISYLANGGKFSHGYDTKLVKSYYNQKIDIYDDYEEPIKEGSQFIGWKNFNGETWEMDRLLQKSDAPFTAQWLDNEYDVTFDYLDEREAEVKRVTHGSKLEEIKVDNKTGYKWLGWHKDKEFKVKWDFAKDIVTETTTLYGNWEEINYQVDFDSKGGTSVPSIPEAKEGSLITEPDEPFKDGFGFGGWYKDESLNELWDFKTDVVTQNMILYAKWNEKIYTVEFETNGGSNINDANDIHHGQTVSKPADPTKEGYNFWGWYVDEDFINEWNFSNPVESDMTLYAKWEIKKYSITFNTNGGDEIESFTAEHGSKIEEPMDPIREGYGFAGWFSDVDLSNEWLFENDVVTEDVTLYAKWTENLYTVDFNTNGGSYVEEITNVHGGDLIDIPEKTTRLGYKFLGWFKDVELTEAWDFYEDKVYGDITLHAGWENLQLVVLFNSMGGSIVSIGEEQVPYITHIKKGSKIEEPEDPILAGYGFGGWYKGPWISESWNFDTDVVETNMQLFAHWNENLYTIQFESNGGSLVEDIPFVHSGDTVKKPVDPNKEGYIFTGWYIDEDLTTLWDFDSNTISGDTVLYAGWESQRPENPGEDGDTTKPKPGEDGGTTEPKPDDALKGEGLTPEAEKEILPVTGMGYSQAIITGSILASLGLITIVIGNRKKNQ